MAASLNDLHDILANLVNSMTGFLQISHIKTTEKITNKIIFHGINTFRLFYVRASAYQRTDQK